MNNLENKKKFKLFDMNRDGKGVDPGEDTTPNLKFFFKQLWRKLSKIVSLNIMMIFQIIPIIICLYLYFVASPKTPSQYYPEFAALFGIQQTSSNAVNVLNIGNLSFQFPFPAYDTYIYWVIGILIAVLVITYGWQKVGSVYVTRGLVRGDSVFAFSDFFYAIKKNWKQGLLLGLIDCVIMFVLGYDFYFFLTSEPTGLTNFMYVMTVALIVMYILFRSYTYLMIITFNIKLGKVFKNALIFTVLGIKRNIMMLIGLVAVTAIAIVPIVLLLPVGLGVAIVLPLIYYLGVCEFVSVYAAYPVIKKYMIDPVPTSDSANNEE